MDSSSGDGKQRTRLRHVILVLLIWMFLYKNVRSCSSTDCNAVLREAEGGFTSPCYPQNYPNLLTCTWKMQAPPGYIIQLSFLDFELEEASGCMYDQVVVNTGNADAKFCGLTANGLTLNSTGNFMELSFKSDFSVRKRGFSVSFRHVAVALRNQKVTVNNGNGQVAMVSSSVAIPTLLELTVCFEVERIANKQREWLFSYYGSGNSVKLSFGSDQSGTKVVVDGELCPVGSIISTADFTSSMRPLCLTWTSSNGQLAVYFNGVFSNVNCSASINHFVPAGGIFQLGGQQSFDGNIYNLRLWNHTMTVEELRSLTCDQEGNVIDWDNSHWTVPSSLVQIDNTLSCSVNTPFSSGCTTMGCPVEKTSANSPPPGGRPPQPKHLAAAPGQSLDFIFGLITARDSVCKPAGPQVQPAIRPCRRASSPSQEASLAHTHPHPKALIRAKRFAPIPSPSSPREPPRSRTQSFLRGVSAYRTSKLSLGYISTPLRKRPNSGRRPPRTTFPPGKLEVRITKPTVAPTARPELKGVQRATTKESATAVPRPPAPQGPSAGQHQGEALDTKESSMSPSALSYRKNKPVGRHWSLLSTSDWTHAPDDPPTSDIFMYDLVEASGSSNVHDAPPSLEGSAQTPPEPSDSSLPEKTFQKDSEDDPEDTGGLQPKISPPPPPSSAAFAPPKLMIVAEIFQQDPIPASVASYCSSSSASQPLLFPLKSAPSSQTPPSILPSPPPRLTFISSFSQMEQSFPENSPPPLLAPSRHQFEALAVPAGRSPPSFSDSFDGGLPPSEGQSPIGASHALSADGGRTFDSGGFLFLSAALPVAFPSDLRDSMETPPLPHPSGLDRSSSDFSTTAAPLHEEKSVSWTSSPSTWRPGPRGGLSLAVHADAPPPPPLHPGAEESLSAVQTLWAGSRPSDQKLHLQNQRIPDSAHAAAGTASAPDRHTSRVLQFSAFPLPTLQASQSPRHPIPTPQLEVTHQNNRHSPEQTLGFDAREESNPNVQHAEVWPSLSLSDSLTPLSSSSSVHINLSLSPPLHPSSLIISSFTPLPPSSSLPPVLREQTAQQPPHRKNAPSQRPGHKKEFSVPLPSPAAPPQPLHSAQTQNERPATPPRLVSWFGPAEISPKIHPAGEMDSGEFSSPPRSTAPSTPTAAPVLPTPPHAFDLNTPSSTPPFGSSISALNQSFAPGHEYLQRPGSETGLKGSSHSNKTAVVSLKEGRLEALTTPPSTVPAQSKSKSSEDPNPGASGILDPEHGNPSPTPHVVLHAHEPMKDAPALGLSNAVSVSAHGGGGDATDLAAALSGPCQCKRRFDLSCLCGVSSGNSMWSFNNDP